MPNAMPPANPEKTMKKNWHRGPDAVAYRWKQAVRVAHRPWLTCYMTLSEAR